MARIGIFGGTFNPPHNGHLAVARAAVERLELDSLLVVPAKTPPHKDVEDDPGAEVRFELCEQAFRGEPRVVVSRLELDREGPSWTVDTLKEVVAEHPDCELVLILGEDAALSLPTWKDPEVITGLATIAWVARADGLARGDVGEVVRSLGAPKEATLLPMDPVEVSSTSVRESFVEGRGDDALVPQGVATMISERSLYHRESS